MARLIKNRYDFDELIRRIFASRASISPLTFSGFELANLRAILESAIDFQPSIPDADRSRLIWQAIQRVAARASCTAQELEQDCADVESEYLRQTIRAFTVATSISVGVSVLPQAFSIDGTRIRVSQQLPRTFSRAPIQDQLEGYLYDGVDRFAAIRIPVRARTEHAAITIAIERLDYWRAILNFTVNARTALRRRYGSAAPVNTVRLGPIHTLHDQNGLASDLYFFETSSYRSPMLAESRMIAEAMRVEGGYRRRILSCPYGAKLRALLVRYSRALDELDYEVAFSKLWGVLEGLADAIGEYDLLIERVVFLYSNADAPYMKLLMQHLRDVRNGIVHESRYRDAAETHLYQLKVFVESLFRFHLAPRNPFRKLNMAASFLSLPRDHDFLRTQVALLRRAQRFRTPGSIDDTTVTEASATALGGSADRTPLLGTAGGPTTS